MIVAHHLSPTSIAIELAVVIGLVLVFGSIWLKERRRRLRHGGSALLREASAPGDESPIEEHGRDE